MSDKLQFVAEASTS